MHERAVTVNGSTRPDRRTRAKTTVRKTKVKVSLLFQKSHERPICMKINEYFCRYRLLLTFLSKPESVFLRASSLLETSFFVKIFLNNNKMKMIEMMSH